MKYTVFRDKKATKLFCLNKETHVSDQTNSTHFTFSDSLRYNKSSIVIV